VITWKTGDYVGSTLTLYNFMLTCAHFDLYINREDGNELN